MALLTMKQIEELSPVFKGKFGHVLARCMLKITAVDKIAEIYDRHEDVKGPDFVNAYLKDIGVNYEVSGLEQLQSVTEGPFITISNHPYGALDGIILIDLIGHSRPDYKVMANKFLSLVKTLQDNFIMVSPEFKLDAKPTQVSISGVKKSFTHLREGHPLGIFPAGAVSDLNLKEHSIRDREWQEAALRLIKKAKVPVVPVRFFDRNSNFFYGLGLVNKTMRVLRLPREVLNKGGKLIRVGIGKVLSVAEMECYKTIEDLGVFLRQSVYGMDLPDGFISRELLYDGD